MTTITLANPLNKSIKTTFENEKEVLLYFIEVTNYDYIDFKELDKIQVTDELSSLVKISKEKDISDFDNI